MNYLRIELNSTGTEEEPEYFLTEYDSNGKSDFTARTMLEFLKEHYIIKIVYQPEQRGSFGINVDIAHNVSEADEKSHLHLQKLAEGVARDKHIDDLIDNTKHSP